MTLTSQDVSYASIFAEAIDVSDGTEDGQVKIQVMDGGSLNSHMRIGNDFTTFDSNLLITSGNVLFFEGSTNDAFEMQLTVADPTADRTITLPDATGTVLLTDGDGSSLTALNATQLTSGTVPNARLDQQLQDVAGLAVTNGNFIVGDGSNFVAESGSTARASLGLGTAATSATGDFATAAQGSTADSAMQDLSDDTSPTLGGALDTGGNQIKLSQTSGTAILTTGNLSQKDLGILRAQTSENGSHGFTIKYMGTRTGNNNSFSLFMDNQSGTDVEAITVLQDGKVGINKTTPTAPLDVTGNIVVSGTVDGRDLATDGSKLDGIEASADVTDTANVTAAGALMDSEVTNLTQVKAFDSSDYATAAQGSTADSAMQDLSDDTTPQLGGNLDLNSKAITGTGHLEPVAGTTYTPPSGAGSDTSTDVALALRREDQIVIGHDGYVRRMLHATSGGDIHVGHSSTTSLLGAVKLYPGAAGSTQIHHKGTNLKIDTTDAGINVTGTVTDDGATHDGDVTFTGANYNVVWDKSDNRLEFADNAIASFGDGADLRLFHNGTISYIQDAGTGGLRILGNAVKLMNAANTENMLAATEDGAVELYYDNAKKLETTSSGVNVVNTEDGGPIIDLISDDPADAADFSTEGKIRFTAENSASESIEYASCGCGRQMSLTAQKMVQYILRLPNKAQAPISLRCFQARSSFWKTTLTLSGTKQKALALMLF